MTGSPIVVLDVGAAKVLCLVGEVQGDEQLKILGLGTCRCTGVRRSVVIDMPRVVDAIRTAVREAESTAGLKITGAYLGMAGENISVHTNHSTVAISGTSNPIDERDVQRALAAAERVSSPENATVLHRFVQSYAVDGEPVQNPLWLHGNKLEIETLSITASGHACTTLQRAAAAAGIEIAGFILETVATAAALISPDEREMGIALVDLGAGTTDMAIFHGPLRHVAEIPFGGDDLTKDLSVVLNMSPREAEKLKREFGQVCCPGEEDDEAVSFRTTAGRPHTLTRHQLSAIIEARQQEIVEFVAQELERSRYGRTLAAGLIFTGGGALLKNVDQLGEDVLGLPVRIGAPAGVIAPEELQNPRFATGIGLLRFATDEHGHEGRIIQPAAASGRSFLDKISKFFSFL